MDNAEKMCDSVCIIARGEKVLDGSIAEVRQTHGSQNVALNLGNGARNGVGAILRDATLVKKLDENNRFFEIELAAGADPQALLRRLIDAGATIERFELVQPSLHQVFIQRVGANGVETGMSGHG
jgi:ABC-2 type transport system ATP-binding protein